MKATRERLHPIGSEIEEFNFIVDLPNPPSLDGPWIYLESFQTREEAIEWIKEVLGGDDEGRICLLSEMEE